jgi:hypothetical protein
MDQNREGVRWWRVTGALVLSLVLLVALLPSTGGIIAGPAPNPRMWRCGPFLFYPGAFFGVVGTIMVSAVLTVFGIVRRNRCEVIGWVLLGLVLAGMFLA